MICAPLPGPFGGYNGQRWGAFLLLAGITLIFAAWSMTQNCALRNDVPGTCAYTTAFWYAYPTADGVDGRGGGVSREDKEPGRAIHFRFDCYGMP